MARPRPPGALRYSTGSMSNDPYRPLGGGRNSLVGAAVQTIKEEDETYNEQDDEDQQEEITFRQTEMETIEKVLAVIDRSAEKRIREGFSDLNFTAGVLNCFLVCVTFGRFPQHFWLLYLIESLYLLPQGFWFNVRAQPLNQVLYYLDYCWVMNLLGNLVLLLYVSSTLLLDLPLFSRETRHQILLTAVGTSTGTLTGACLMLPFVAIVFHDLRTMTGVLIHLLPTMMTYTFLWHRTEIRAAWPRVFPYDFESSDMTFFPKDNNKSVWILPGTGLGSIAGNAIALYTLWWVLVSLKNVCSNLQVTNKKCVLQCDRYFCLLVANAFVKVRGLDGVSGRIEFAAQRSIATTQIRYRVSLDGTLRLDGCRWQNILASPGSSQFAATRDGPLRSARFLCVHVRARIHGVFRRHHDAGQSVLALAASPCGHHFATDCGCCLSRRRTLHVLRNRNVREKRTKRVQGYSFRRTAEEEDKLKETVVIWLLSNTSAV